MSAAKRKGPPTLRREARPAAPARAGRTAAKAPAPPAKAAVPKAAPKAETPRAAPVKAAPTKGPPAKAPPAKAVAKAAPVPAAASAKTAPAAKAAPIAAPSKAAPPPAKASAAKARPEPAPKASEAAKSAPARPPRPPPVPVASSSLRGVTSSGSTARSPDSPHLRVGDDLPAILRGPLSRVDIARYCGASGTFNPISIDEPFARQSGLPSVVVPGGLALGLAGAALSRWLRDEGRVARLGARLVKMVWPGDQITARARVSELRPSADGREIDLDVWVENQKGELVLRGQATCHVRSAAASAARLVDAFTNPFAFGSPQQLPPPLPPPAKPRK